ncbi:major facilitator superfamily protein [Hirsutella rhossiliensis]|uniref:Quinate transporter n=1 Tax=Hirsutella rhossiliensis TaxID=111463 RepID=A0A9P8MWU6_9HYPO|nr:sugar transporter domain-containing protein [Hirsutella rhossiliensis]KAH0962725.1 sugar transporter domain-containing protein [Hirsutella rhossiliensis]
MALLTLVEDRPTPKAVYNRRVYLCATAASFASCMIGYDSAFIGTTMALPSFAREFAFADRSPQDLALLKQTIVSVYQAGALLGSLVAYALGHFIGRRRALLLFATVFLAGAGMMLGATRERGGTGLIVGGRVLAGFAVGGCSNITPIYISELAPPAVRGRLVGIYELGWQVGGLAGFWINYGVDATISPGRKQWRIPFAVQLIPGGLLLIGALFIPESPRWLFSIGRRRQATEILCWVRGLDRDDAYVVHEIGQIDAGLHRHQRGFWKPFLSLKKRRTQWRFLLGVLLFVFQNGSGINAINYYSPTVFRNVGIRGTSASFLTTGIFGVVKTVLTIVWLLVMVDHVGRRKLLMIGAVGGSLCMWCIGALIKISDAGPAPANAPLSSSGIAAVFFLYLWTAFYVPTWNGTPWVISSEMFDPDTRSLGQANAAANNWLWNFIVTRFTEQMFLAWRYGVFFLFASLMAVSFFFVFFCVPETKSIPLECADRLFETKPTWRANVVLLEELRQEDAEATGGAGARELHNMERLAEGDKWVTQGKQQSG